METLYAVMETLLPFEWISYTFMKNALLALLMITPLFGLLGTMAVDNKMAFFSDALGHSALTGVALGALSGGELQRVLLALALSPQPDLLILDEPVSGVDQNGLEEFYQTVDELKRKNHMAILLVSHDLAVVERYADRVVLMQGTVVKQGAASAVFASPEFEQVFYARGGHV